MTVLDMSERPRVSSFKRESPPLLVPPGNLAMRALAARIIARAGGGRHNAWEIAEIRWPLDRAVQQWLTRAASAPAMTSVAGWAAELAIRIISDQLEALAPASAGAQLLREGLVLAFDGAGSISAPGFVADAGNAGFVAEGDPIPVRQLAAADKVLNPYKLATIAVLTREMIDSSNAEALIGDVLVRSAGAALDAALFDSNAATAARPPGLRNGIATLTASTNTDFAEAFTEDFAALINAVAPVGGTGPYVFIASPGRAAAMNIRLSRNIEQTTILPSNAVGDDLICIAAAALVAALDPDPEIETANAGTLHMDDAPQAVGSVAPHRSLFQTDSIAIKVRWPVTWALRDSRGVAWLTPAWK